MKNPYTWRGLLGAIGVILLIWWALSMVMGAINGRLPVWGQYTGSIGGEVIYLAFYYGTIPAIAAALMYYGGKRR